MDMAGDRFEGEAAAPDAACERTLAVFPLAPLTRHAAVAQGRRIA